MFQIVGGPLFGQQSDFIRARLSDHVKSICKFCEKFLEGHLPMNVQHLSALAERMILVLMENVRTQLSPVQKGRIWRVRITWPNGKANYVGKFSPQKDAIEWIEAHPRLIEPVTIDEPDWSC